MPIRDFFRNLIGVPEPRYDENNNREVWSNDVFHDFFRDFSGLIGENNDQARARQSADLPDDSDYDSTQNDFGFSLFPESDSQMFRHFEQQFMKTFQQFGFVDFPTMSPGRFLFPRNEDHMPRDDGGEESGGMFGGRSGGGFLIPLIPDHQDHQDHTGQSLRDHLLKKLPPSSSSSRSQRQDTDLDQSVSDNGGLAALLDSPASSGNSADSVVSPQSRRSVSSSISVQTITLPDGSVEEKRVVCRPDGSCERTITRHRSNNHSYLSPENNPHTEVVIGDGNVDRNSGGRVNQTFWRSLFNM